MEEKGKPKGKIKNHIARMAPFRSSSRKAVAPEDESNNTDTTATSNSSGTSPNSYGSLIFSPVKQMRSSIHRSLQIMAKDKPEPILSYGVLDQSESSSFGAESEEIGFSMPSCLVVEKSAFGEEDTSMTADDFAAFGNSSFCSMAPIEEVMYRPGEDRKNDNSNEESTSGFENSDTNLWCEDESEEPAVESNATTVDQSFSSLRESLTSTATDLANIINPETPSKHRTPSPTRRTKRGMHPKSKSSPKEKRSSPSSEASRKLRASSPSRKSKNPRSSGDSIKGTSAHKPRSSESSKHSNMDASAHTMSRSSHSAKEHHKDRHSGKSKSSHSPKESSKEKLSPKSRGTNSASEVDRDGKGRSMHEKDREKHSSSGTTEATVNEKKESHPTSSDHHKKHRTVSPSRKTSRSSSSRSIKTSKDEKPSLKYSPTGEKASVKRTPSMRRSKDEKDDKGSSLKRTPSMRRSKDEKDDTESSLKRTPSMRKSKDEKDDKESVRSSRSVKESKEAKPTLKFSSEESHKTKSPKPPGSPDHHKKHRTLSPSRKTSRSSSSRNVKEPKDEKQSPKVSAKDDRPSLRRSLSLRNVKHFKEDKGSERSSRSLKVSKDEKPLLKFSSEESSKHRSSSPSKNSRHSSEARADKTPRSPEDKKKHREHHKSSSRHAHREKHDGKTESNNDVENSPGTHKKSRSSSPKKKKTYAPQAPVMERKKRVPKVSPTPVSIPATEKRKQRFRLMNTESAECQSPKVILNHDQKTGLSPVAHVSREPPKAPIRSTDSVQNMESGTQKSESSRQRTDFRFNPKDLDDLLQVPSLSGPHGPGFGGSDHMDKMQQSFQNVWGATKDNSKNERHLSGVAFDNEMSAMENSYHEDEGNNLDDSNELDVGDEEVQGPKVEIDKAKAKYSKNSASALPIEQSKIVYESERTTTQELDTEKEEKEFKRRAPRKTKSFIEEQLDLFTMSSELSTGDTPRGGRRSRSKSMSPGAIMIESNADSIVGTGESGIKEEEKEFKRRAPRKTKSYIEEQLDLFTMSSELSTGGAPRGGRRSRSRSMSPGPVMIVSNTENNVAIGISSQNDPIDVSSSVRLESKLRMAPTDMDIKTNKGVGYNSNSKKLQDSSSSEKLRSSPERMSMKVIVPVSTSRVNDSPRKKHRRKKFSIGPETEL